MPALPKGHWMRSLPNLLTLSRIAFVPLLVWALWEDNPLNGYIAAGLFILASLTDYVDGFVARRYKIESLLGKFMDPVSDKILVTSTLVMMIPTKNVSPILVILLLSRDVLIGGLRSVAAAENIIIGAGNLGKWKTALQMVAIPAALIEVPLLFLPSREIGIWGLWASVVLSLVSGFQYVRDFMKAREKNPTSSQRGSRRAVPGEKT